MAQDTRYSSHGDPYEPRYYDDQYAEPVDLDEFGSQLRSHHRSIVTREEFLPDDSVPLFLSGPDGAARTPKFGSARKSMSSRLVKTGILALAASVAAFTAVTVKNPFTVFANATASLIGTSDIHSASLPSMDVQATVSARAASASANQPPTRDEIAGALRAAHHNVAPAEAAGPVTVAAATAAAGPIVIAAAPAAAAAPPPAAAPQAAAAPPVVAAPAPRKLAADELATLMTRAKALLAAGDIPSARLLLERAAEAQEASAALMLAQTYDPTVLGTRDARNINTDQVLARTWYQRAAQLGSVDAQRRLSQLQ